MSDPKRYLFDECIGKPVMQKLKLLVSENIEFQHIVDKFASGEKDEDWIPKLGTEGGWVVITSDAGKHSRRGHKLPDLCSEYKVTHIILSNSLHQRTNLDKIKWLGAAWQYIEVLHDKPPGSRFHMRLKSGKGKMSFTILVEPFKIQPRRQRRNRDSTAT